MKRVAKQYTISDIKSMILPILKKYSVQQAVLFGSYARNEATPESDIDLMIIGGQSFEPTDIFCIADELYNTSGKDVDVYEKQEIEEDSDFYRSIIADGVTIR